MAKKWTKASEETKAKAVARVLAGETASSVARDAGVSPEGVRLWVLKAKKTKGPAKVAPPPVDGKSPLERENEWLWGLVKRQIRDGKLEVR